MVLPWVETTLGLLLMLGLVTRFGLIAGSLVMTLLVIGANLAQIEPYAGTPTHLLFHLLLSAGASRTKPDFAGRRVGNRYALGNVPWEFAGSR